LATKPLVNYLRIWDKIAAQRPDFMVAISNAVKKRIRKYYKRESEVIYPPVDVAKFRVEKSKGKLRKLIGTLPSDYYLIVSRLVSYKRIDLAIEAFNKLARPLVIVGTGKEEKRLKSMSKDNIIFRGFVSEEELPIYYQNATALIYPQEEDFGITAVESQAAGTPVIAYKKGGVLDTVIEGKTGVFFERQTASSLIKAIKEFDNLRQEYNPTDCVKNARNFSKEKFKNNFKRLVEKYVGRKIK